MVALDIPFTAEAMFPLYDRRAAGAVSAEDFALTVTLVRRGLLAEDQADLGPGSPMAAHASLAFDAYHAAVDPPKLDADRRPRVTPDHVTAAISRHNASLKARKGGIASPVSSPRAAARRGQAAPPPAAAENMDVVTARSLLARVAPGVDVDADGVDKETFILGTTQRCPILFGVFFLSVSFQMERLFRARRGRAGDGDAPYGARSYDPDSLGVLE